MRTRSAPRMTRTRTRPTPSHAPRATRRQTCPRGWIRIRWSRGQACPPTRPCPLPTRPSTASTSRTGARAIRRTTNGDVGPTYYIQTVNTSIGIYDKSTGARVAAFTFNAFMSQGHFGNLCDTNNFGDPVVLYDSFEDRWIITDFAFALDGSGNVSPQHASSSASPSRRPATRSTAAGTTTRSIVRAASATTRSSASGRTASTCRRTCSATRPAASYQGYARLGAEQAADVRRRAAARSRRLRRRHGRLHGHPGQRAAPDGHAAGRDARVLRLDLGVPQRVQTVYKFHVDWDKISTSTFTGPDVPSSRRPAGRTRRVANASTPGERGRRARRSGRWRRPSTRTIGGAESLWVAHTVNRGDVHARELRRDARQQRHDRAGTRSTSPAAPSPPTSRPGLDASTRTARTRSSASCRRSPSTAPATWRSATRSRTRRRTRRSSTRAGSPATRSTRSARPSRR